MKTVNTPSEKRQLLSLSDHVAYMIARQLAHFSSRLAISADRFLNKMPAGCKKAVFILTGITSSFLLLWGLLTGSPIPARSAVQLETIHIGQASGLPGGKQPVIQPDTVNTK